ncbi:MAG: hypothetical protein JNL18_18985 [Planctomycetaceae bacterium]|nr:hypothetical protein [Planctomycetaceae bacterium]
MSVNESAVTDTSLSDAEQWADHPLAHFFAAAWRNTVRSFSRQRAHYETLAEVDGVFRELVEHAAESPERLAGSMLIRTHGSFLAASSLALSGQIAESYALMRNALRSALHGVFIAGDAERQRIWVARADDEQAAERMRAAFATGPMLRHLRELDAATSAIYERLQQRTIERGAHPNAYGTLAHNGDAQPTDFSRAYLVTDDEVQRMALRTIAQVGICALSMFYYVFGDLYREQKLDARLAKLRHGH